MPATMAVPGPAGDRRSSEYITGLLTAWRGGEESALAQLTPLVHRELRRLARSQLRGERHNHTLQTDALVNEAFLRLVDLSQVEWRDRAHFFALSARLMRRILVDYARSRGYQKRGGGAPQLSLDEARLAAVGPGANLVALDEALASLAAVDPRKAKVVELRFFGGLSVAEAAEALQVSEQTVMRDWRIAKMWLLRELSNGATP